MKVLVIDWFNLVKRYMYREPVESEIGELIDTVTFTVLNRLCDLYQQTCPDIMMICSDLGFNARAKSIVSDYKANRKKGKTLTEAEKENSYIDFIKRVAHTLPCPFIEAKNVEADMIIRCVVKYLHNIDKNIDIVIASSDSDFIQLLDKRVSIFDWYKGKITIDNWYLEHKKHDKYLNASNYALGKAIVGDSSDNIEGIKGWGWKKVTRLFDIINEFYKNNIVVDNLDGLVKMLNEVYKNIDSKTSDAKTIKKALEAIEINQKIIENNIKIIDLNYIETPHLYQIYAEIERQLFDAKIKFDKTQLLGLMSLGRYAKDDKQLYDNLIKKNSKAMFIFFSIMGKTNNAIAKLKTLKNK